MSGVRLILAVVLLLVAQLALVNHVSVLGVRPDLLVLLLVFLAQRRGPVFGTVLGFAIGLLEGLFQPQTLGMQCLSKSLLGFCIGKFAPQLLTDSLAILTVLVGLAVLLHDAIFLLAYTHLSLPRFLSMYFTNAVPTALYTALVGGLITVVAAALGGGSGLMGRREGRFGSP